jgi:hypothetical protein
MATRPVVCRLLQKGFEERWEGDIDKALSNASNVTKEKVDPDSADQVKTAASKDYPTRARLSSHPDWMMCRFVPDVIFRAPKHLRASREESCGGELESAPASCTS